MNKRHGPENHKPPIALAYRLARANSFNTLFANGMKLIEETADYLDKKGRQEQMILSNTGSVAFTRESMQLTTRLMQLAAWLLLQRSMNNGDISPDTCTREKSKLKLGQTSTTMTGSIWDEMPGTLKTLIERSIHLEERIRYLDAGMGGHAFRESPKPNKQKDRASNTQSLSDRIKSLENKLFEKVQHISQTQ